MQREYRQGVLILHISMKQNNFCIGQGILFFNVCNRICFFFFFAQDGAHRASFYFGRRGDKAGTLLRCSFRKWKTTTLPLIGRGTSLPLEVLPHLQRVDARGNTRRKGGKGKMERVSDRGARFTLSGFQRKWQARLANQQAAFAAGETRKPTRARVGKRRQAKTDAAGSAAPPSAGPWARTRDRLSRFRRLPRSPLSAAFSSGSREAQPPCKGTVDRASRLGLTWRVPWQRDQQQFLLRLSFTFKPRSGGAAAAATWWRHHASALPVFPRPPAAANPQATLPNRQPITGTLVLNLVSTGALQRRDVSECLAWWRKLWGSFEVARGGRKRAFPRWASLQSPVSVVGWVWVTRWSLNWQPRFSLTYLGTQSIAWLTAH